MVPERLSRLAPVAGLVVRCGVILGLVGHAALAVWAARGLFADGSWFFWSVLSTGEFTLHTARVASQSAMQLPLLVATSLGVEDISALARVHSLGSGAFGILAWSLALLILLRDRWFWPMVTIFSVVFLNTGFMSIGEYNIAYGLVAVIAAILLREGGVPRGGRTGILIAAALLLASYESMLMLGPVLIVLTILRWRRTDLAAERTPRWTRTALSVSIALYSGAALYAAINILFPVIRSRSEARRTS